VIKVSKESIAVINGHEYKYRWNSDIKEMDYLGPVGDSPTLSEEELRLRFTTGDMLYEQTKSYGNQRSETTSEGIWTIYVLKADDWKDYGKTQGDVVMKVHRRGHPTFSMKQIGGHWYFVVRELTTPMA
jgi:hypothetical protein